MKKLKRLILVAFFAIIFLIILSVKTNAAVVKVTGDVLNIRKEPSTSSKVIAMISKGVECELLEEEEEWYKVKYKNYTGYVSKQYSEIVKDSSDTINNTTKQDDKNVTNNKNQNTNNKQETINSQDNKNESSNNLTDNTSSNVQNNTGNTANTQNKTTNIQNNKDNATNNTQNNTDKKNETTKNEDNTNTYKKITKNTDVKILPLIHSSKIETVKKDAQVIKISEMSGWAFIQTDTISGWVRNDVLGDALASTTTSVVVGSTTGEETTNQKTAYVSEELVNLRKGAGTSHNIIKVLTLNTKITIIEEDGDWYKVKAGNDTGYISKDYVSDTKKVTTRSNASSRTEQDNEKQTTEDKIKTTNSSTDSATNKNKNTNSTEKTTSKQSEKKEAETSTQKTSNTTKKGTTTKTENKTTSSTKTETIKTENKTTTSTKTKNTKTENKTTATTKNETKNVTKGTDIIAYAKKYLGHKYVYGGDGSNGTFDCSGFTKYVFKHFGISLPHGATSQYRSGKGTKITKQSSLQTGDIVFLTDYETGVGIGHCGIYIGNGNFIHASTTTYTVIISSLNTTYSGRFYAGLRLI